MCSKNIIKISSITISTTNLILNSNFSENIKNLSNYKLVICSDIPTPPKILPVTLSINGKTYNVLANSGNLLMSDQISKKCKYDLVFGNNPAHFLIKNCLPKTKFIV